MTPVSLITGFLGSGKTTLLRRIARTHGHRRLLFLVNEFSSVDVDGPVLREEIGEVVSIPGGSIFCKCLVAQFITQMRLIAARAAAAPLEGVVIEASGMADPRVMGTMLAETGLDRQFRLASVFTVLDPVRFLKLLHTLPAVRAQVEAADTVILNKTDLCTPEQLAAAEAAVRALQPGADLRRAVFGEVELDLFPATGAERARSGEYAKCRDPNFETEEVPVVGDVDPAALGAALRGVADDVYRMKGFANCGGVPHHWDYAGGELAVRAVPGAADPARLVFIVRGGALDRVRRSVIAPLRAGRSA